MNVKKSYKVGDTVWIYGIDSRSNKSHEGKIVKSFNIDGYNELHYVVAVPTEIEPLLEIRTWQSISQDKDGHVGGIRESMSDPDAARRMLSRIGLTLEDGSLNPEFYPSHQEDEEDDIDPDLIHAAMERANQTSTIPPLNLKENKPKRRYFKKKPKT